MEDLRIGLTRSGRSVHQNALHKSHNSFCTEERQDAIILNNSIIKNYKALMKVEKISGDPMIVFLYRDAIAYYEANIAIYKAIDILNLYKDSIEILILNDRAVIE